MAAETPGIAPRTVKDLCCYDAEVGSHEGLKSAREDRRIKEYQQDGSAVGKRA
jgi:hypothetical protein